MSDNDTVPSHTTAPVTDMSAYDKARCAKELGIINVYTGLKDVRDSATQVEDVRRAGSIDPVLPYYDSMRFANVVAHSARLQSALVRDATDLRAAQDSLVQLRVKAGDIPNAVQDALEHTHFWGALVRSQDFYLLTAPVYTQLKGHLEASRAVLEGIPA